MSKKITYYRFAKLAEKNGVIDFRIDRVASEYTHDYYENPYTTKEEKKWTYEKGYASYKLIWYGMTKENYNHYISDFVFYNKNNYMNREFEGWFDHKLSTYYLLIPFKNSMPRHYYFIDRKRNILPIDVEDKHNRAVDDIVDLVKSGPIAAKAVRGGHGAGFYKLEYEAEIFKINNVEKGEREFRDFVKNLNNYIISDYVKPHSTYVNLIGKDIFAVLRVVTVYDKADGPQITSAIIRLGSKKAGVVCDEEGTILCGIRLEDGTVFKPLYKENNYLYSPCPSHPDTGENLEGWIIPNWNDLKKLALEIAGYIPMTPYLVIDIIPTEEGFSILEINSHGQVRIMEPFYPFMDNPYNRKVF
ncbi:MAG: sugar-transfer associated ATP-grasp domain-containing protein [Lachnospiraceae bacterium]